MNGEIKLDIMKKTLVKLLEEATGVAPFIREDQAGPRPESGNYGTIKLTPPVQMEGHDSENYVQNGNKVQVETAGQRELTLSVNLYRENANQIMTKLQSRIQSRSFREKARLLATSEGQAFSFIDALAIQDLTALLESNYEERSQMDVRLRAVSSYVEEVDSIGTVTLDGNVENIAGEVKAPGILPISDV